MSVKINFCCSDLDLTFHRDHAVKMTFDPGDGMFRLGNWYRILKYCPFCGREHEEKPGDKVSYEV